MSGPTPRTRSEELLLARISAAAGRARLGRRLTTHAARAYRSRTRAGLHRAVRRLSARVRIRIRARARALPTETASNARLDLYEHGMTVAVGARIRVVRYDTTSVFRPSAPPRCSAPAGTGLVHTLTDIEGKCLVLQGGLGGGALLSWEYELRRAVTRAQLPRALAALHRGERVSFGDLWTTADHMGSGTLRTPWHQVQDFGVRQGVLTVTTGGRERGLGTRVSKVPNLFVFRALAEHLRTEHLRTEHLRAEHFCAEDGC
ncbi:DUF6585 family protein [Streptomyces sp. NPDC048416]|uniref:DUF6585 family protein n=1 Tax=Streptomyces sp. NPDC048416 TaxID=3365546 RepID=UPI00371899BD